MTRTAPRLSRYRRPDFLVGAVLVFCAAIVPLLLFAVPGRWQWPEVYLIFVVVTILAVRVVPVEPGALLRRRVARRTLVGAIVGICLLMVIVGGDLGDYLWLGILGLVFGDVLLGRATQRMATAPDDRVDEWQESLRNQAHRTAYWLVGVGFLVFFFGTYVATEQTRAWLSQGRGGGLWIVSAELLFCLPAMVIAWNQSDPVRERLSPPWHLTWMRRATIAMVSVALLAPVLASLALPVLPITTQSSVRPTQGRCLNFRATETVGIMVEAQLPIAAQACWNGRRAFETFGMNRSDCMQADTQMATLQTISCQRTVSTTGTLRFVYTARVGSPFLPFIRRAVSLRVTLTRAGRVLQFP
ncbi:MAG: hypothetical protein M0027_06330 [Candidatus Dormibacteraeota bacterium]|nr:hypothetical protein [Candidatus Dormibacteraeota bacterium]